MLASNNFAKLQGKGSSSNNNPARGQPNAMNVGSRNTKNRQAVGLSGAGLPGNMNHTSSDLNNNNSLTIG
jgi:hypothetical protein